MKNSDKPAHPIEFPVIKDGVQQSHQVFTGLTKREYFAGLAMQGLYADGAISKTAAGHIAKISVQAADALLAELE